MSLNEILAQYEGVPLQPLQRAFLEKIFARGFMAEVTGHASKTIRIRRNSNAFGYINSSTIGHPSVFGIHFPERFGGIDSCPDEYQAAFERILTKDT
jgi:hypothetical protein